MVIDLITKLEIKITFIYGLKSFFPLKGAKNNYQNYQNIILKKHII
jgi:hypothetical protein